MQWETVEELKEYVIKFHNNCKYKEMEIQKQTLTVVIHSEDDFNIKSIHDSLQKFKSLGLLNDLPKKTKHSLITLLISWLKIKSETTTEERYGCPLCTTTYAKQSDLKKHFLTSHLQFRIESKKKICDEIDRKCDICDLVLCSAYSLKQHKLIHEIEKKYKCSYCDKTFYANSLLKNHVNNIHTKIKKYPCPHWDRIYYSSTARRRHFISDHETKKNYKCDICFKSFQSLHNLKIHKTTHMEPTLKCPEMNCSRMFKSDLLLNHHLETHRPERERRIHECTFCQKKFLTKLSLKTHLSCHTGERTFECKFCDERFRLGGILNQHLLKHTKEKPYPCGKCDKAFGLKHQRDNHLKTHRNNV